MRGWNAEDCVPRSSAHSGCRSRPVLALYRVAKPDAWRDFCPSPRSSVGLNACSLQRSVGGPFVSQCSRPAFVVRGRLHSCKNAAPGCFAPSASVPKEERGLLRWHISPPFRAMSLRPPGWLPAIVVTRSQQSRTRRSRQKRQPTRTHNGGLLVIRPRWHRSREWWAGIWRRAIGTRSHSWHNPADVLNDFPYAPSNPFVGQVGGLRKSGPTRSLAVRL